MLVGSFKEVSWSTASRLITVNSELAVLKHSAQETQIVASKDLKECDAEESDSLIWCCLKLKMHMRLLTLCLIMHPSHCLAVISSWSPKFFWGALQDVKKVVIDEWHSPYRGSVQPFALHCEPLHIYCFHLERLGFKMKLQELHKWSELKEDIAFSGIFSMHLIKVLKHTVASGLMAALITTWNLYLHSFCRFCRTLSTLPHSEECSSIWELFCAL